MAIVRGPFDLQLGSNVITDVEEAEFEYEVETTDYTTVQGNSYEVAGAHSSAVNLTLLDNDVEALAVLLPQYHVPQGGTLSTGETVTDPEGAIDLVPGGCESETLYNDLIVRACGTPREVLRMLNVRSEFNGFELDGPNARRVTIRLTGEPLPGTATIQFYREGGITSS